MRVNTASVSVGASTKGIIRLDYQKGICKTLAQAMLLPLFLSLVTTVGACESLLLLFIALSGAQYTLHWILTNVCPFGGHLSTLPIGFRETVFISARLVARSWNQGRESVPHWISIRFQQTELSLLGQGPECAPHSANFGVSFALLA